jgi:hypothetical protein
MGHSRPSRTKYGTHPRFSSITAVMDNSVAIPVALLGLALEFVLTLPLTKLRCRGACGIQPAWTKPPAATYTRISWSQIRATDSMSKSGATGKPSSVAANWSATGQARGEVWQKYF